MIFPICCKSITVTNGMSSDAGEIFGQCTEMDEGMWRPILEKKKNSYQMELYFVS